MAQILVEYKCIVRYPCSTEQNRESDWYQGNRKQETGNRKVVPFVPL